MRRAMRHAQLLGAREPLMHRLVWALVREMGQAYPELVRAEKLIEETLRLEETRFRKTLERGLSILDEKSAGLKKGDMFDGDTAFTLYDTYGFPLDLTQDALLRKSIGSAIMGPQVFEKSLSCVNNLLLQAGRPIVGGHTICVVDLQDGGNWDWAKGEPPKDNPAYYLRFCKSYSRMGGAMRYIQCDNVLFLHHLFQQLAL